MKVRDVLKLVAECGWYLSAQKGSHHRFKHPELGGKVTVAGPSIRRGGRKNPEEYS
jgi:predicted RNA binding protein YcfA (HicA-like mRNA interferase family)